jgi:hypothetical protein
MLTGREIAADEQFAAPSVDLGDGAGETDTPSYTPSHCARYFVDFLIR